ncbi:hypothetical protein VN1272_14510 [Helicobacter pylori]|nr:hypothetical protein VN1272_14510 [Helicobacter pylori]
MNPEKATHCKEIRKILKEALHGNKDLNFYFGIWRQACQADRWGVFFNDPFIAKRQKKHEKL